MGVWYSLELGEKFKVKYCPLNPIEKDYADCDSDGNVLKKVSGKFEKGYFLNEKTGEKIDKAYKLINGKASEGFKGRITKVENYVEVEDSEGEDLLVEKEYLLESEKLFDYLTQHNKAVKFAGWFGNGFKAYKCYITPSKLYKGFCNMRCGRTQKSELMRDLVGELTEYRNLKSKLAEVELSIQKVNRCKVEELIPL